MKSRWWKPQNMVVVWIIFMKSPYVHVFQVEANTRLPCWTWPGATSTRASPDASGTSWSRTTPSTLPQTPPSPGWSGGTSGLAGRRRQSRNLNKLHRIRTKAMEGPPSDQVGSLLLNHEIAHFKINKNNCLTLPKPFLHFLLEITNLSKIMQGFIATLVWKKIPLMW